MFGKDQNNGTDEKGGAGAGSQTPPAPQENLNPAPQGKAPEVPGSASPKGPDAVYHELTINGKKERLTTEQLIARGQQVGNITQREQEVAQERKDLAAKMARLDELLEEAEKGNQPPEEVNEMDALKGQIGELKALEDQRQLDSAMAPVKAKFPDLDEDSILTLFLKKVKSKELENSAAGIMKAAEEIHSGRETMVKGGLEKLLTNHDAPELKAYNEKLIADYVAGKYKISNAGGDLGGAGGAGNSAPAKGSGESISDIAQRLRTS